MLKSLIDDFMNGEADAEEVYAKCAANSKSHLSKAKQLQKAIENTHTHTHMHC